MGNWWVKTTSTFAAKHEMNAEILLFE